MSKKILIVDDEEQLCISLARLLRSGQYEPLYTTDPRKVRAMLDADSVSLLVTDFKMPGISGIDLIQEVRGAYPELPIIMVSGYASVHNVVNAMRCGALNFYEKPVRFKELLKEIDTILEHSGNAFGKEGRNGARFITMNAGMQDRIAMLRKAAPTAAPVLLTGESGTGKEIAAAFIHAHSGREDCPFIKINCAAIPEDLLESELFGYEKGAFTGADESRTGKLEAAEGGTLFLDEIGEMSPKIQAKILRVIQEQEYERLGSHRTRKMDVRVIAATNRNLENLIRQGSFREDLYYRLSVIQIRLLPLRERKDDILPLAEGFLREFSHRYGKTISGGLSPAVQHLLIKHEWPGNVRELKNTIERMIIFCESDEIGIGLLPEQYARCAAEEGRELLQSASDNLTRDLILGALRKTNGGRSQAAELLGITRRTLYNKIKKLGIEI